MMRHSRSGLAGSGGFTLIETIAALLLTGVFVTLLVLAVRQWSLDWHRTATVASTTEALVLGEARLVADLSSAIALPAGNGPAGMFFSGRPDQIALIGVSPAGEPDGPRLTALLYRTGAEGGLVRRSADPKNARDFDAMTFGAPIEVLPRGLDIRFAYADGTGNWAPSWTLTGLPDQIRVMIAESRTFDTPRQFTIAVHANRPALCGRVRTISDCNAIADGRMIDPQATPKDAAPAAKTPDNSGNTP